MPQSFECAYIRLNEKLYLKLVMVLVPLINFLSGLVIDMYAPSMPQIAVDFHVNAGLVENTITATIFGYAVGSLVLGILFDSWGRRKIIIITLSIFVISSALAPYCNNIYQLIIIRFLQGVTAATMSVGCRVIAADHFTGQQLTIAVLYASFGFGIGSVIAPFIGGYLQYHLSWHANFYTFAFCGCILLTLFTLFIHERFSKHDRVSFKYMLSVYKELLVHKKFLAGVVILSITQLNLMFYPTVAPFLVEHQLHYSSITYGNTALIVSLGYLIGTISNRVLLQFFNQPRLITIGFAIFIFAVLLQLLFALIFKLNLWCLVIPMFLICFGTGFIIGNVTSTCMQLFPSNMGIVTSTIFGLLMSLAALGNYIISCFIITDLMHLFFIFLLFLSIQITVYKYFF